MTSGANLFFDFIGWAREGLVEGTSSPYSDSVNVPSGRPAVARGLDVHLTHTAATPHSPPRAWGFPRFYGQLRQAARTAALPGQAGRLSVSSSPSSFWERSALIAPPAAALCYPFLLGGLVVLEDPMSSIVLVKHHPNRSIERGLRPIPVS